MEAKNIEAVQLKTHAKNSLELVEKLRKFSVFSDINDEAAIHCLVDYLVPLNFKAGSKILTEGKIDEYLYLLMSGRVEVLKTTESGDTFKVVELEAAMCAYFGEGAILDSHPRSATILAIEPTLCLALSRNSFDDFCRVYPHWGLPLLRYIAKQTAQRLRKLSDDYVFLYHAYVREIRGT